MANRSEASASPEKDVEGLSFEDALARLELLVERLEDGGLELEAALAAFEEGVRLSRSCASQLERAERRIEELIRTGGELVTRPFEERGESD